MAKKKDPKYTQIMGEKDYYSYTPQRLSGASSAAYTQPGGVITAPTPTPSAGGAGGGGGGGQPIYGGGYGRRGGQTSSGSGGGMSTANYQQASMYAIAQAMLPYLGETEQANLASWLKYNAPSETSVQPVPSAWASNMFTKQRASQAAEAIKKAALTYGADTSQLGPGYQYLMDTVDLLSRFSGDEGISRANYDALMSQFKATQKTGDFGIYQSFAQSFINPTIQGQSYFPRARIGSQTVYGQASRRLFG